MSRSRTVSSITALLAVATLSLSANAAITQRAQQQAAGNAYRAAAESHNEAAEGFQRFQNAATAIRNGAVQAEKVLGRMAK